MKGVRGLRETRIRTHLISPNNLKRELPPSPRVVPGGTPQEGWTREKGPRVIRWKAGDHYLAVGKACTEVQVFHRQYRENEAKTMAKVKVP